MGYTFRLVVRLGCAARRFLVPGANSSPAQLRAAAEVLGGRQALTNVNLTGHSANDSGA